MPNFLGLRGGMVDAIDSKSIVCMDVSVRVGPEVPHNLKIQRMLDYINFLKAALLGLVESLTEFLPVSSTAHLLIASQLIDFNAIQNSTFEIVIQFGAIAAILVIYRQRFFDLAFKINEKKQQKFALNLAAAFLPAAIIGALFHDFIKQTFFSNSTIALALIFGGFAMIAVDTKPRKSSCDDLDKIKLSTAFLIGLFQCVAMIPGVSRSGATIIGALLCGLNRKTATEFSFFLAVPTIGAASFYDLIKNLDNLDSSSFSLILVGLLSSFFSAFFVIKWFISFVSKNNFLPFAFYRIVLGCLILFFLI